MSKTVGQTDDPGRQRSVTTCRVPAEPVQAEHPAGYACQCGHSQQSCQRNAAAGEHAEEQDSADPRTHEKQQCRGFGDLSASLAGQDFSFGCHGGRPVVGDLQAEIPATAQGKRCARRRMLRNDLPRSLEPILRPGPSAGPTLRCTCVHLYPRSRQGKRRRT
jgi:hypothetical protein